jgi:hypothetical protein
MRKACFLAAILLLSVCAFAQTAPPAEQPPAEQPSNPAPAASQASGADRAISTIEGCLASSAGRFTLTDSSGKAYQLDGDTAKLAEHVGHTLRISGSAKNDGADPQGGGGSSAQPTFTVKGVRMVSPSCSTSSK